VAVRGRIAPIGWSIALHAVLAGLLYLGITLRKQEPAETTLPIDAVVVDQSVLEAAGQRRTEERRDAVEERREAEARAEAERLEQERVAREQQQQRLEEQQQLEAQQRLEAEQKARIEAEARRKAEELEAQRRAEEEAKAKTAAEQERATREARLREQREADLREQLAEEESRASPGYQSLKASYVAAIQAHVERRWFKPPGTTEGLVCRIFVMQIPGGEVVGTRFGACNGNAAMRQSIETAVRNASPLPAPPDPSLFEREVELVFTPKESRN
jgi:colicin import membrane protein